MKREYIEYTIFSLLGKGKKAYFILYSVNVVFFILELAYYFFHKEGLNIEALKKIFLSPLTITFIFFYLFAYVIFNYIEDGKENAEMEIKEAIYKIKDKHPYYKNNKAYRNLRELQRFRKEIIGFSFTARIVAYSGIILLVVMIGFSMYVNFELLKELYSNTNHKL